MNNVCLETILCKIAEIGRIRFDHFMELALYGPGGIYRKDTPPIGKLYDYISSASVGPEFGILLGQKLASIIIAEEYERPVVIEIGAGTGHTAYDILSSWARFYPRLFDNIQYYIIEPWDKYIQFQRRILKDLEHKVKWYKAFSQIQELIEGVVFSNEVLDSLPVRRLRWDGEKARWYEWYVTAKDGKLSWEVCEVEDSVVLESPSLIKWVQVWSDIRRRKIGASSYTRWWEIEYCPVMKQFLAQINGTLKRGYLVTIDYGYDDALWYWMNHPKGSIRGFKAHKQEKDLLKDPGHIDITVDVNFEEFNKLAQDLGFKLIEFNSQEKFICHQMSKATLEVMEGLNLLRLKLLFHPNGFGARYYVIIHKK